MRILGCFLILLVSACGDGAQEEYGTMSAGASVELKFDVSIEDVLNNSPVKFDADCLQDADFCLYEFDRPMGDSNLPSVIIRRDSGTLEIDDVATITTSSNTQQSSKIDNFKLTVRGLPDNRTHEENKTFIYALIEKIQKAGWQRFIAPSSPRISGSEAGKISSADSIYGVHVSSHPWFDPTYTLDLQRWMQWGSFYVWSFYNDGIYMKLSAWRQKSPVEPDSKGTYLITVELQTDAKYWQNEFEPEEQKGSWKSLVSELKIKYKEIRERDEELLRSFGVDIDEGYQDPSIKQLGSDR